jgi:hypothetical protein
LVLGNVAFGEEGEEILMIRGEEERFWFWHPTPLINESWFQYNEIMAFMAIFTC